MKQMITHNLGLKLLSLIVAFICWLVIINISDPTITRKFDAIPVTILNENVITSADCVYEVVDGDTVDVTVKGKRSIVERIKKTYFSAKADLSKLSKVNAVAIDVSLSGVDTSNLDWDWNNAVLKVSLEKKSTENFKVIYKTEGELTSSYILGDVTMNTPILEVSGGTSMMKKIKSVGVVIKLDKQKKDFETELAPILYDSDGHVIKESNITFNTDKILVKVSILPSKTIPVYIDVKGSPKDGYRLVQTNLQPETIRIAGSELILKDIASVKIPVNVNGASKDVEAAADVADYLPSGIKVVEEYQTVSYRCVIERDGKRTLTLANSDITIYNMGDNMSCTFPETDKKYYVNVSGKEEDLADITSASLEPYLDLSDLGVGTHSLTLQFKLPSGVTIKNKIKVKIKLEESIISEEVGGETQ